MTEQKFIKLTPTILLNVNSVSKIVQREDDTEDDDYTSYCDIYSFDKEPVFTFKGTLDDLLKKFKETFVV